MRCELTQNAELISINKFRETMNLKPIEIISKSCLDCEATFKSSGPQNKLCNHCRTKDKRIR